MTVEPSTIGSTPSRVSRPPATSSGTAASSTVPTVAAGMPPSTDSESGVQAVEPDAMLLTSGCGPTSAQALYAFAVSTLNWSAAERTSPTRPTRSEEHTSELQSQSNLVCRLLLEKKKLPNTSYVKIIIAFVSCSSSPINTCVNAHCDTSGLRDLLGRGGQDEVDEPVRPHRLAACT